MLSRQTTGSVVCPTCGRLVGVRDPQCLQCGRRNPGMWGYAPLLQKLGRDMGFVPIVIGGCITLFALSFVLDPSAIRFGSNPLGFLAPGGAPLFALGSTGAWPVLGFGRWWTLLSGGWLHGSLLHIAFNMLWVRQLGPITVQLFGVGRAFLIYMIASVAGFALTVLGSVFVSMNGLLPALFRKIMGGSLQAPSVGASAAVFGLLGALVYAGYRAGHTALGRQVWTYSVVLFIFGLVMPGIDNWAHLGGFLGGYVCGKVFDPRTQETPWHLLGAVLMLALTAGSVLYSYVTFLALAEQLVQ